MQIATLELHRRLLNLERADRARLVFGSDRHQYRSTLLSEAALSEFEREHRIVLPAEYRSFLLEVGSGAGPHYGLLAPSAGAREFQLVDEEFGIDVSLARPCPFSNEMASELLAQPLSRREGVALPCPLDGTLPICFHGCTFWTVLALNGEQAGMVWYVASFAEGEGLWVPAGDSTGQGFSEWYDAWLTRSLSGRVHVQDAPGYSGWPSLREVWRRLLGGA